VENLPDAVDVGIRFGVDQARVAVAGVASHTFGLEWSGFFDFQPERNRERVDSQSANIVLNDLHAWLI